MKEKLCRSFEINLKSIFILYRWDSGFFLALQFPIEFSDETFLPNSNALFIVSNPCCLLRAVVIITYNGGVIILVQTVGKTPVVPRQKLPRLLNYHNFTVRCTKTAKAANMKTAQHLQICQQL